MMETTPQDVRPSRHRPTHARDRA